MARTDHGHTKWPLHEVGLQLGIIRNIKGLQQAAHPLSAGA